MKVISFGDSFTSGVGTDWIKEKQIKEENKDNSELASTLFQEFTTSHSFTRYFADKLKVDWVNKGEPGCCNKAIITSIFQYFADGFFDKGDLVLVSFTSTTRDDFPFFPTLKQRQWKGLSWNINDIYLTLEDDRTFKQFKETVSTNDLLGLPVTPENTDIGYFLNNYKKFFVTEMFDYRYLDFFNFNMIALLQQFFDYIGVDYILIDAFEPTFNSSTYDKRDLIDTYKHYWGYNTYNIYSYLEKYEDRELFELEEYVLANSSGPKHPSTKGHKLFAETLYKYYKKTR